MEKTYTIQVTFTSDSTSNRSRVVNPSQAQIVVSPLDPNAPAKYTGWGNALISFFHELGHVIGQQQIGLNPDARAEKMERLLFGTAPGPATIAEEKRAWRIAASLMKDSRDAAIAQYQGKTL